MSLFNKRLFFGVLFGLFSLLLPAETPASAASYYGVYLSSTPTPAVITPGGQVGIHWTVAWGESTPSLPFTCAAPGLGNLSITADPGEGVAGGDFAPVSPSSTTSYALTCRDQKSEEVTSNIVTVTVTTKPVVTIMANPSSFPSGGGTTYIDWQASQVTSCTASGGTADWRAVQGVGAGGHLGFKVTDPTTFTLSCSNSSGDSATASASVSVGGSTPPPPPAPASCGDGKIDAPDEACDPLYPLVRGTCPNACSLACTLNNCAAPTPPSGYLTASKVTLQKGEEVTLTWDIQREGQPYQCNMESYDPNWNDGSLAPASGTRTFVPANLPATTSNVGLHVYSLCSSATSRSAFEVWVQVVDAPVIDEFKATPNPINVGQSSTLSWKVRNAAEGCMLFKTAKTNPPGEMLWSGDGTTTTEKIVTPTTTTDYILQCTKPPVNFQELNAGYNKTEQKIRVTVTGTPDPGTGTDPNGGGGNGGGGGPTSSLSCGQGVCQQAGCQSGYTPTQESCNNSQGSCCVVKTTTPAVTYSTPFSNPLAFNTVEGLLNTILSYLQGIIVILSLIMIVIGALMYMTAGGNDKKLSSGKMVITAALVGLALALAAPSFLKQIGDILGWNGTNATSVSGAKTLVEILQNALNFLLSIIGILGIIMLVVGGLMYLTAAGDEDRIKTGKTIVQYSLIGIAVALAALVLVTQVISFFS